MKKKERKKQTFRRSEVHVARCAIIIIIIVVVVVAVAVINGSK